MPVPADTHVYDQFAYTWWDEKSFLYFLQAVVNPGRVAYIKRVLLDDLALETGDTRILEIGCCGGFLTEAVAALGFQVTGIDPSGPSVEVARVHALQSGFSIDYQIAAGEFLPFADASFGVVCCCDVLEHVKDPVPVLREAARVLRPGGVFIYSAPNRTMWSYLALIWTLQKWSYTRLLPENFHDWRAFIAPPELTEMMARAGLTNRETVGLSPNTPPWRSVSLLHQANTKALSFGELGERFYLETSDDRSAEYAGYGIKTTL